MKKFVALLLALTMVFALAACGANSTPATQPDTKTETPAENTGDTAPATTPEYTIKFATGSTADLEKIAETLLANTVIEDFDVVGVEVAK